VIVRELRNEIADDGAPVVRSERSVRRAEVVERLGIAEPGARREVVMLEGKRASRRSMSRRFRRLALLSRCRAQGGHPRGRGILLHIDPITYFIAGGIWMPRAPALLRI
jgi:hypothetical protein